MSNKKSPYITVQTLPVAETIALIQAPEDTAAIAGYTVNVCSIRLQLFAKTPELRCVACGVKAKEFRLQHVRKEKCRPHLNLYAVNGVLLTKDHIHPKSKGGSDALSNMQLMCTLCNSIKGNTVDTKKHTTDFSK